MEAAPAGSAKAPLASPQATATAHRGLIFMASSCTRGQAVDRRAAAFSRRPNTAVAGAALDDKHGANARGGAGYENIMPAPTTGGAAGSGAMALGEHMSSMIWPFAAGRRASGLGRVADAE